MSAARHFVAVAVAVAVVLTGCGEERPSGPVPALPERVLPPEIAGLTATREASADKAFASAGDGSLTARGAVWTLRADGAVRGALQVGVLKPEYDAEEIEVRRGVRSNIETGQYRWFKVDDQWVGVQDLPELKLYLWFPPGGDLYEVLQLQPDVPDQKTLLRAIIDFQEDTA